MNSGVEMTDGETWEALTRCEKVRFCIMSLNKRHNDSRTNELVF